MFDVSFANVFKEGKDVMRKLLLATTVALSTGAMMAPVAEAGPYGRGWGHGGGYGHYHGGYGGGYGRRGIGSGAAIGLGIAGLAAGAIAAGAARDAYYRDRYYYGPRYRYYGGPYYDGY